jgi:hypothetical protein
MPESALYKSRVLPKLNTNNQNNQNIKRRIKTMRNDTEYADIYDLSEPTCQEVEETNKNIFIDGFSYAEVGYMLGLVNELYYGYKKHLEEEVSNGVKLERSIPDHLAKLNRLLNSSSVLKSLVNSETEF